MTFPWKHFLFLLEEEAEAERERVVEVAIDHSVPDLANFVTRVCVMKSDHELKTLFKE